MYVLLQEGSPASDLNVSTVNHQEDEATELHENSPAIQDVVDTVTKNATECLDDDSSPTETTVTVDDDSRLPSTSTTSRTRVRRTGSNFLLLIHKLHENARHNIVIIISSHNVMYAFTTVCMMSMIMKMNTQCHARACIIYISI